MTGRAGPRRLRRALLAAIALLYAVSIPWYRRGGDPAASVLGLPDWLLVAIACYAAVAVLNAAAWLLTELPDAGDADASADE